MSRGLLVVAEMLGMIGKAAKLATADIRETVEAKRDAEQPSGSAVSRASGTGAAAAGMGAAASNGVTANGLAAALQITRGRLP